MSDAKKSAVIDAVESVNTARGWESDSTILSFALGGAFLTVVSGLALDQYSACTCFDKEKCDIKNKNNGITSGVSFEEVFFSIFCAVGAILIIVAFGLQVKKSTDLERFRDASILYYRTGNGETIKFDETIKRYTEERFAFDGSKKK